MMIGGSCPVSPLPFFFFFFFFFKLDDLPSEDLPAFFAILVSPCSLVWFQSRTWSRPHIDFPLYFLHIVIENGQASYSDFHCYDFRQVCRWIEVQKWVLEILVINGRVHRLLAMHLQRWRILFDRAALDDDRWIHLGASPLRSGAGRSLC